MTRAVELIRRKRDGEELAPEELAELVLAYALGEVPDYQMSAFLMAVFFRGLTVPETAAMTEAMVRSGETVDLSALGRTVLDKHSTGGVGDKTSIALGPVVAACGAPFAKMSGRGLGHTGGTLDKLEAIPGFRVELGRHELVSQVATVGMAIVGQTEGLVPADRLMYALRDVTGTVDSPSLIAASVMSKKIAAGADAILLDVKVGEGAFMRTRRDAQELAEIMLGLGRAAGREVVCELTDMSQPLGRAVGNALEVREAIATLRGEGPPDFVELVLGSAGRLLAMSDLGVDAQEGSRLAGESILSGRALAAFERWIEAQGGDPSEEVLPRSPVVAEVHATASGFVGALDPMAIGQAAVRLGAGRAVKGGPIDHATGVVCRAKRGDPVRPGDVLAEVHARDGAALDDACRAVLRAYRIDTDPPPARPLLLGLLGP